MKKLEAEKKVVAGGIPLAAREIVFIAEVNSNEEIEKIVRSLPMRGILNSTVTPLISFTERATADSKHV